MFLNSAQLIETPAATISLVIPRAVILSQGAVAPVGGNTMLPLLGVQT